MAWAASVMDVVAAGTIVSNFCKRTDAIMLWRVKSEATVVESSGVCGKITVRYASYVGDLSEVSLHGAPKNPLSM